MKEKIRNIIKKLNFEKTRNNKIIILTVGFIIVLIITLVGEKFFYPSHAQTPTANVSAKSGTITSPAQLQTDQNSSTVQIAQFGSIPSKLIGAYSGYENITGIKAIGTQLGHPLTFVTAYLDYRDPTNGWGSTGQAITAPGYFSNWQNLQSTNGTNFRMVWGLPMLPTVSLDPVTGTSSNCINSPSTCWTQGANGDYNSYFKTVAQNLVKYGQANSIIRIGWEFNSKNFNGPNPWFASGYSAQFVPFWQNIVTTMRSVSGQQFEFDWNPTIGSNTIPDFTNYYPGDSYVDTIGLDIYNNSWFTNPIGTPQSRWNVFLTEPQGLNWFSTFGLQHKKSLSLPEWGLGWTNCSNGIGQVPGQSCPTGSTLNGSISGGDDSYFVQQVATYISTNNFIEAGVWSYGVQPLPGNTKSQSPNATVEFIKDF